MTRLKSLRNASNISQSALAEMLNVKQNTISSWESGRTEPDFESIRKMSELFEISSDYLVSAGVFQNWEVILQHHDLVWEKLRQLIPNDFEMSTNLHSDRVLIADLDVWLNYDFNELLLARWFQFAVKRINFNATAKQTDVSITFTEEFETLLSNYHKKKSPTLQSVSESKEAQELRETMDALSPEDRRRVLEFSRNLAATSQKTPPRK